MSSIKEWIDSSDMNVTDFSRAIGVSRASVYQYLNGRSAPSVVVAMRIRLITGMKFSQIIDCFEPASKEWSEWMEERTKL